MQPATLRYLPAGPADIDGGEGPWLTDPDTGEAWQTDLALVRPQELWSLKRLLPQGPTETPYINLTGEPAYAALLGPVANVESRMATVPELAALLHEAGEPDLTQLFIAISRAILWVSRAHYSKRRYGLTPLHNAWFPELTDAPEDTTSYREQDYDRMMRHLMTPGGLNEKVYIPVMPAHRITGRPRRKKRR